jgi:NADP-dependent 3-hydroxy acid dehydrogenase YdfG
MARRVAVITGASSGIGRGIAAKLVSDGFQLVLSGRSVGKAFEESDDVVLVTDDLTEPATSDKLLETAIDIERVCSMARLKVESAYRLIYTFLKYFVTEGKGHVVITSSVLGTKVRETVGAYAGCNFAMEALAEGLGLERSDSDIQVSCIEPGLVETNPQGHWPVPAKEVLGVPLPLQPEDIADVVEHIINRPAHVRIPRYMILPRGHKKQIEAPHHYRASGLWVAAGRNRLANVPMSVTRSRIA